MAFCPPGKLGFLLLLFAFGIPSQRLAALTQSLDWGGQILWSRCGGVVVVVVVVVVTRLEASTELSTPQSAKRKGRAVGRVWSCPSSCMTEFLGVRENGLLCP